MYALALLASLLLPLASALPTTDSSVVARDDPALEFTMALPAYFCADSRQTLYWRGGSGTYNASSVLHYAGYDNSYDKIDYFAIGAADERYEVSIGRIGSEFPAGSTLQFDLTDVTGAVGAISTAAVPIYTC